MIDRQAVRTGRHHRPDEKGWNVIAGATIVLIPGHDQQAVVRPRPLDVAVEVNAQPGVALLDRATVHVVINIGHDDRHGRQLCVIRWEVAGERHVVGRGHVRESNPGVVFGEIGVRERAAGEPGVRQALGIAAEAKAGAQQFARQVGR